MDVKSKELQTGTLGGPNTQRYHPPTVSTRDADHSHAKEQVTTGRLRPIKKEIDKERSSLTISKDTCACLNK